MPDANVTRTTLKDVLRGATAGPNQPPAAGEGRLLPLDGIEPNPFQHRTTLDPEKLEELVESIRTNGLVQPITVRRHPEDAARHQLIAGERRWRAHQLLRERASTPEEWARPARGGDGLGREPREAAPAHRADGAGHPRGMTKGLMVPVVGDDGQPLTTPTGRAKQEHRHLDLMAALEFDTLLSHRSRQATPRKAEDRVQKAIVRALQEGWSFRRIQEFCREARASRTERDAGSPASSAEKSEAVAPPPPLFRNDEQVLVVYRSRLQGASPHEAVPLGGGEDVRVAASIPPTGGTVRASTRQPPSLPPSGVRPHLLQVRGEALLDAL